MELLKCVAESWGWLGLRPKEVLDQNVFGNIIVLDESGCFWRICPEELSCEVVAQDAAAYEHLRNDDEFLADWEMLPLVEEAYAALGALPEGCCYCLKIPAVVGGEYAAENMGTISRDALIAFAGDLAQQIRDLPDGTQVELRVTE